MKQAETTFLKIAIFVSFLFLAVVISPFLTTLILAAVLVTGTMPIRDWVLRKVRGKKRTAAFLMAFFIGLIFSTALFVFIILLSQEAVSTYQSLETLLREGRFNVNQFSVKASKYFGIPPLDIISSISQAAQTVSTALVAQSTELIKSLAWLLLNFFLLVLSMYFFYKDGESFVQFFENVIPLPKPYPKHILNKFRDVSLAMLYGIFLTAFIQGILGGIGLALAGIGNPIFWGTVMGFFGMLPIGGTGIIWLPAGLFLLFTHHYIAGVGLILWGGLLVAFVDNIIKPLVISRHAQINPLTTFLVVVGGLMVFGLKGAIIAPMVLAGLVALIQIHKNETGEAVEE